MCEKYERCQHTSSTRKFKKIERGVKLCAGRNTTCLATAQQAVCILLAARSYCGYATHGPLVPIISIILVTVTPVFPCFQKLTKIS